MSENNNVIHFMLEAVKNESKAFVSHVVNVPFMFLSDKELVQKFMLHQDIYKKEWGFDFADILFDDSILLASGKKWKH